MTPEQVQGVNAAFFSGETGLYRKADIDQAIAQERARLREEVVKLMVPDLLGKDAAFYGTVAAREFVKIHNAALADVLALLNQQA